MVYDATYLMKSYIIRAVTATISCIASSTIASVIMFKLPDGLSSPYRRILLCLSIADVIQTICIICGPFAVPAGTPDTVFDALGNTATCSVQGFFLNVASAITPMYTFGLSIYFLLRVKYRMPREDFAEDVEWILHTVALLWNLLGNSYAFFTKSINATRAGSLCTIDALPLNCDVNPDQYGECIRGKDAIVIKNIVIYAPVILCFIGMCVCLGILTCHVIQESKKANANSPNPQGTKESGSLIRSFCCYKRGELNTKLQYQREMLMQSCLYAIGFLFVYSGILVNQFLNLGGKAYPPWSHLLVSFTWPLGGFVNILIFTRPKIAILRIRQPQYSWFKAFSIVVCAGAEIPDEIPDSRYLNDSSRSIYSSQLRQNSGRPISGNAAASCEAGSESVGTPEEKKKTNGIPSSFANRPQVEMQIESRPSVPRSSHFWSEALMLGELDDEPKDPESRRFY